MEIGWCALTDLRNAFFKASASSSRGHEKIVKRCHRHALERRPLTRNSRKRCMASTHKYARQTIPLFMDLAGTRSARGTRAT